MAAETGNNAAVPGAIIPVLTLAVPGSAPAAVLLAALFIHGVRPGPLIMIEFPGFIMQVVAMLLLATFAILVYGLLLTRPLLYVLAVPRERLMPVIFVLCTIGSFAITSRLFDVYVMLTFGLIGLVLREMRYPMAPLVLGLVLGAGIFRSPAEIEANAGSAFWLFAAWLAGGAISLGGALCYAELATAFPNAGGDYHFLKTAYGREVGFLFAWARFAVINTGSIALLGFALGDYANVVYSLGVNGASWYALIAILLLTVFNLKGLYRGASADYSMTGLEVGGLVIIFFAGVVLVMSGQPPLVPDPPTSLEVPRTFGLALLFVLFAFSGWSEVATMSAEIKDARRGMVRALVMESNRFLEIFSAAHELHPTDMTALNLIMTARSPMTPGALAKALNLSASATTSVLDRLARAGHVVRDRDPEDRRRVELRVLDAATALT